MSYKTLNDASCFYDSLAEGDTEIWYQKEIGWGCPEVDTDNLEDTHVKLGSIVATNPDSIFGLMQGEVWSRMGEARDLIIGKGLRHTSMSVGDIMKIDGELLMVDSFGFKKL
jgi:hypothetical protein